MLNELDKKLEERGHPFVRYADDMMIFCKSRKAAERTLANIKPFIEKKLFLKLNEEKTKIRYIGSSDVKFLGFGFYAEKGGKIKDKPHQKLLITAHYGTVRWVVWKDGRQNNCLPIRLDDVLTFLC